MQHAFSLKKRQQGLTMFGFLFVAVVLVMLAVLAMKLVPAYVEYFSVKKMLVSMGQDPELKSRSNAQIRGDFSKKLGVGYVTVVGADDVWGLLPRLKAAGASGILVLPIEKIVP